jgi:hypothetical protein
MDHAGMPLGLIGRLPHERVLEGSCERVDGMKHGHTV